MAPDAATRGAPVARGGYKLALAEQPQVQREAEVRRATYEQRLLEPVLILIAPLEHSLPNSWSSTDARPNRSGGPCSIVRAEQTKS